MNTSIEPIARQYFAYSNKAQLNNIRDMFAQDATYSSAVTGLFFGIEDIMTMMTQFFQQYQKLYWKIDTLNLITDHIVEINFTLTLTTKNGKTQCRSGIERLVINNDKIRHIEIQNQQ